ncbi:MAG: hypothetical protein MUE80_02150, partial [Acidobacteria bacterium]|nr:hypothetical protein [Acidobacteriota bacterium]
MKPPTATMVGHEQGHLAHGRHLLHFEELLVQARRIDVVAGHQAADAGQLDVGGGDGVAGDGVVEDDDADDIVAGQERHAQELVDADEVEEAPVDEGIVGGVPDVEKLLAADRGGRQQGRFLVGRVDEALEAAAQSVLVPGHQGPVVLEDLDVADAGGRQDLPDEAGLLGRARAQPHLALDPVALAQEEHGPVEADARARGQGRQDDQEVVFER